MNQLKTDYLIVGSGAVGMAFADTLLTETDYNIIIVDRYPKPGGHWNVAYPFVTLHQPSAFYGVSSRELSKGKKDKIGLNKGLNDLATGAQVSAYFEDVMRHDFLPSGRVQYFPMCDYSGNNRFKSMLTGDEYEVEVEKKIVDATYLNTSVPSTHIPNFTIDKAALFMPLNDLPKITSAPEGFVVIGGGKTGIDACLWLIENKVDHDKITWIVSRDAWLIDRENTQPSLEFFEKTMGAQADQFEAVASSTSIEDMFDRLESAGVLLRIDQNVRPKMFHGATVSRMELEELRKIKNVIRLGRVNHIGKNEIILEAGSVPTTENTVHIDCSASAITNLETKPIFQGNVITPQTVRSYQPVFSASVIAYVESNYPEEEKNKLCAVVPLPNHDTDWIKMLSALMMNQYNWSQDKELRNWLTENRLDGFAKMVRNIDKSDTGKMAIMAKMKKFAIPAVMKLQQYVSEINEPQPRS